MGPFSPLAVPSSHRPMTTTATPIRSTFTSRRRSVRARARAFAATISSPVKLLRDAALRALIAQQHLIPQVVPDLLIDASELRLEPDLSDVARPRQIHGIDALYRAWSGGDDEDLIRKGDRFLEVVRDEYHRSAGRGPQLQQFVLHQRACLHVERAERLVHQQDSGLVDQRLRQSGALAHAS